MKANTSYHTGAAGILLLFFFLLPSLLSLYHGLFEHQALSCTSGIGVHFHESEIDCDFGDFTVSNSFMQESREALIRPVPYCDLQSELYVLPPIEAYILYRQWRGPPRFL